MDRSYFITSLSAKDDSVVIAPGVLFEIPLPFFRHHRTDEFLCLGVVGPEYLNSADDPPIRAIAGSSSLRLISNLKSEI